MTGRAACTAEHLKSVMDLGGRATISVRSRSTGRHITLRFVAKKRDPDGGFVSRARSAGRVGIPEADFLFIDDPTLPFGEGRVASMDLKSGVWREAKDADPSRVWAASRALRWAAGGKPDLTDQAEVFISLECACCGKDLTDPVSVERGIGPDCLRKATKSKMAPRQAVAS